MALTPEEAKHPQMREVPEDYWREIHKGVFSQLMSNWIVSGQGMFERDRLSKLTTEIMENTGLRKKS